MEIDTLSKMTVTERYALVGGSGSHPCCHRCEPAPYCYCTFPEGENFYVAKTTLEGKFNATLYVRHKKVTDVRPLSEDTEPNAL